MNIYFGTAGILCFLLGLVHSILGEFLIFKNKRIKGNIVPSKVGVDLRKKHLAILWATWHLASVFGWGIGIILVKISLMGDELHQELTYFILTAIAFTMLLGSILVFGSTNGKHPGWIVLLIIGILVGFGH